MRRFSSMLLRAVVALVVVALLSLSVMTAYFSQRMARTQRSAQMEKYEEALNSLSELLDNTFYDYMSYAVIAAQEKELRPFTLSGQDAIARSEAIERLKTLKVCNRSVIDLCIYYPQQDIFITSSTSYTRKSFEENYYAFSEMNAEETMALFCDPVAATNEYGSRPAFIPVGNASRWDMSSSTGAVLILYPLPYYSQSPYASLGILVQAQGLTDQLSLAAGEGGARIVAATGKTLLSVGEENISDGFAPQSQSAYVFTKHSDKFNLDYEIRVDREIFSRVSIAPELIFFLLAAMTLLSAGCLFFARWVNWPVRQILTHIGEDDKLISDESSLIREHIAKLGDYVARSQRSVDELALRRLIAGQDIDPEALCRSDSLLRLDYAHCAVFLARISDVPEKWLSLTCIEREHAVVYLMQESRRDMLMGVISCDKSGGALHDQVEALLDEPELKGAVTVAVGTVEDDPYQLHHSMICADALMGEMLYQGREGVALSSGRQERRGGYPAEPMHAFKQALEAQNAQALEQACEKLCTFLLEGATAPDTAALVFYDLSQLLPGLPEDGGSAQDLCEALRAQVQSVAQKFAASGQCAAHTGETDADERMEEIARCIHDSLESPDFCISLMAQRYGMSDSAFSHMFKRLFGVSFIVYVNRLKIQRAKELLVGTALSVDEIARTLGYSSASNFTRMFKSVEEMTPSVYRQNSRRTKSTRE